LKARAGSQLILIILFLAFAGVRAPGQDSAGGFSLKELLELLDTAVGEAGSFRWDPFFMEGSFSVGGNHGIFGSAAFPGETGIFLVNNRDVYRVPLPYLADGTLVFPPDFVSLAMSSLTGPNAGRSVSVAAIPTMPSPTPANPNPDSPGRTGPVPVPQAVPARTDPEDGFYRIAAVIIDPGHGGRDSGAVSDHVINGKQVRVREADIALNASRMLRDMLVRRFPDKRILMTRNSDAYVSLDARTAIANSVPTKENEAIIFISIHGNAATNRKARGYEVWHLTQGHRRDLLGESEYADSPELRSILNQLTEEAFLTESVLIAQSIVRGMKASLGSSVPNRGLKAENWFVVRHSNMPAVLVELGFVSNIDDARMMTNEADLRKMVEGVFNGIADFVGAFERSGGFITAGG